MRNTRRKRKKSGNEAPSPGTPMNPLRPRPSRHPLAFIRHLIYGLLLVVSLAGIAVRPAAADEKCGKKKQKLAEQFLIFGTVFDERGYIVEGAEIRVRCAGEKKVRWKVWSDRRGEFAQRVPTGAEYELTVVAKGFTEQERKVDAREGNREDMVIRLEPAPKEKKK